MKLLAATLAFATAASAHTTFQYLTDVSSSVMGCNVGGSKPAASKATIEAGTTFTAEFHHELRSSQGVDPSHKGPTMAYMAKVADATKTSDAGLRWFKIYEDGLSGGKWAVDKMNANSGKFSFTIPKAIENGDYLIRPETIGLHGAGSYPGAQLYFGCAQVTVTGASGGNPATVSFPGAYKGSDPGITVNIYTGIAKGYTIPGPRPYNATSATSEPSVGSDESRSAEL